VKLLPATSAEGGIEPPVRQVAGERKLAAFAPGSDDLAVALNRDGGGAELAELHALRCSRDAEVSHHHAGHAEAPVKLTIPRVTGERKCAPLAPGSDDPAVRLDRERSCYIVPPKSVRTFPAVPNGVSVPARTSPPHPVAAAEMITASGAKTMSRRLRGSQPLWIPTSVRRHIHIDADTVRPARQFRF